MRSVGLIFCMANFKDLAGCQLLKKYETMPRTTAKAPKETGLGSGTGVTASRLWPTAEYSAAQVHVDGSLVSGIDVIESVDAPTQF